MDSMSLQLVASGLAVFRRARITRGVQSFWGRLGGAKPPLLHIIQAATALAMSVG